MFTVIGGIVVIASVLIGFSMAGGHMHSLFHLSEVVTIGGASLGALIIMSPPKVLVDLLKASIQLLKGSPYNKSIYVDLLKITYNVAGIARREGILALESHITNVKDSTLFKSSTKVVHNHHAMEFLIRALEMMVEGKSGDAITARLEQEIEVLEREHHAASGALAKTADALPGFGIVAAVLGIVVTMGHIDGPVEEIGHKVGAALVGTFLGILLSYGFFGPMAARMEATGEEEKLFLGSIACAVVAIVGGTTPKEVVYQIISGINTNCRPNENELKEIFGK